MALAVIAINTVSTGGLVAVTLRQRPAIVAAHGKSEAESPPGPVLRMEPLIIQLRRTPEDTGERYLRVAFDLEMKNDADRSLVVSRQGPINDALIGYFSDRTADELRGGAGLAHLKNAVVERLKPIVPGHLPRTVYITDFLIQ